MLAAAALPADRKRVRVYRPLPWLRGLLRRVSERAAAANAWVADAQRLLDTSLSAAPAGKAVGGGGEAVSGGGGHTSLSEALSLLSRGTALNMDDENMLRLSTACAAGKAVESAAVTAARRLAGLAPTEGVSPHGPSCEQVTLAHLTGRSTRGALPTIEQCAKCVADADALPLRFDAVAAIRPVAEAGAAWAARADAALDAMRADAPPLVADESEVTPPSELRARAAAIDELIADGGALPLTLPLKGELEAAAAAARFEESAAALLQPARPPVRGPHTADVEDDRDGSRAAERPSVRTLSALVRSGNAVRAALSPAGAAALAALAEREGAAQRWIDASGGALKQRGTRLARLLELVDEATRLSAATSLPPAAVESVRERACAGEAWLARARPVLPSPLESGAAADELRELVAAAKPLLKVAEVEEACSSLSGALRGLDEWLSRCALLFVKPQCGRPLLAVLRNDTASAGMWPPSDDENLLCCACCTPDTLGVPSEVSWVGCDECDGWFHSYCVRVPDAVAETLDSFRCPRCCTLAGAAYAFGSAALPPPILTTMRPSFRATEALLAAADGASASRTAEACAVRALLEATARWREGLRGEVGEAERAAEAEAAQEHARLLAAHEAAQAAQREARERAQVQLQQAFAVAQQTQQLAAVPALLAQQQALATQPTLPPPPAPVAATGPAALSSARLLVLLREAGELEVPPPELEAMRLVLSQRGVRA